jgi:phosphate/sulfate permease
MPKLAIVLAATVALLFAWLIARNAEATTSGAAAIGAKAYSPIIMEAGCRLNGPLIGANGCRRGTHQVCKKKTGCLCVPC